jgi:DNA-binding transcriptional LysR family regulator
MVKLRALEAFCAAVEEGTISGASRRMYLSQPSVSERLSELEREARVPLLKRSRHGVELTEQGNVLYEHSRKALDEVNALERTLSTLRSKRDMHLYVAASSTLGEHMLPEWFREFRNHIPEVVLELFVGNTQEVVGLVSRGVVAFGIIEGREPYGSLESVPFLDDELVVVVSPDHPWASRGVNADDLVQEPFISRERGSGTREVIEKTLSDTGVTLDVQMELGSTSAIKESIEAGLGFSILSRETIRLELETGHLEVAEGFVIPRQFTIVHSPSAILNPTEQRFYDYLLEIG